MAAVSVHLLAQCITCHAWSPYHTMLAFCPNSNEVHIYRVLPDKWERVHVLQKHDQIVSGVDWGSRSNKIVTVSHDRNSYVWNQDGPEWVPTLVILRLNRAALCVQWSPKENKFAVGSGAKTVCICYYEPENDWWVSKLIRKKHNSSVTSIAWHPNNVLLATTSTDGKCRVFATYIKGVDSRDSVTSLSTDAKFGELILQLDLSFSWAFGVKWSPSGNTLAYVGHNSTIYFVDDVGSSASAQTVAFRDLPLRDVLFVSERMVIGVGFDCNPMFSEAFGKLYGQTKQVTNVDAVEPSRVRGGSHENYINCIVPLSKDGESMVKRFSTSGLDGRVVIWELNNLENYFSEMTL
ncbi:hypothetical protein AMTRI_Chr07g76580 [Amborella trichopoda]